MASKASFTESAIAAARRTSLTEPVSVAVDQVLLEMPNRALERFLEFRRRPVKGVPSLEGMPSAVHEHHTRSLSFGGEVPGLALGHRNVFHSVKNQPRRSDAASRTRDIQPPEIGRAHV
jgi:hypothetical protein